MFLFCFVWSYSLIHFVFVSLLNFALKLVEFLELVVFDAEELADAGRKDAEQVARGVQIENIQQVVQRRH